MVAKLFNHAGTLEGYRTYKNNVLFLVADEDQVERMVDVAQRYLAVRRIASDTDRMSEFSEEQRKRLKSIQEGAELDVRIAVTRTYRWLYYPSTDAPKSAGGLARLPRLLAAHKPDLVVIELGGNDGLRGQPVATLRDNLTKMIELSKQSGADVVLAGIQIPPNYGTTYTQALAAVYPDLARRFDAPLIDFILEDVALHRELMQPDGIHPNAAGQKIVFANVWRVLGPLLTPHDAG